VSADGQPGGSGVPDTAVAQAAAVREGSTTARAVVDRALARIVERDWVLSAFVGRRDDAARAEADALDALPDRSALPLAGVAVAVKDNLAVAGEPMRVGSAATSPAAQSHDHPVVARLRAAGAVVVGRTAVPELCALAVSDSVYGVPRNPWATTRTPGGSSGGSAAAVAAGMVALAVGNDGLGSVRIPAACCGLVGIKPGAGLVPAQVGSSGWFGMVENGPLATTVADVALALSVMAAQPAWASVREPDAGLRLAVSLTPPLAGVALDHEHARAVMASARVLRDAGHLLARDDPPYPVNPLPVLARWVAGPAGDAEGLDLARMDPAIATHVRLGRAARRAGLVRPGEGAALAAAMAPFFATHDVLLTPVLARPPLVAARWGRRPWPWVAAANAAYAPYAGVWNLAGYPAMSVPAGLHPVTGTPLSVQLVAAPGGESVLLGLAATLERCAPWPRLAPRGTAA